MCVDEEDVKSIGLRFNLLQKVRWFINVWKHGLEKRVDSVKMIEKNLRRNTNKETFQVGKQPLI